MSSNIDMELEISPIATTETEAAYPQIEPEDFDWIVSKHQKQIYRVLLFLVRDADAADTLTQECFLRAYQKHKSFQGNSSLKTWLVRIAINLAHDHKRNQRLAFWRRLTHSGKLEALQMPDLQRSPEQALQDKESVDVILAAVEKLSEKQKMVFMLRFIEEMPLEEIASVMKLEPGTVKSHLSRALETVRSGYLKHAR